jgi:hypothetical protein
MERGVICRFACEIIYFKRGSMRFRRRNWSNDCTLWPILPAWTVKRLSGRSRKIFLLFEKLLGYQILHVRKVPPEHGHFW